jgi:hypothetical protein
VHFQPTAAVCALVEVEAQAEVPDDLSEEKGKERFRNGAREEARWL